MICRILLAAGAAVAMPLAVQPPPVHCQAAAIATRIPAAFLK